jgi:hypothetical protein
MMSKGVILLASRRRVGTFSVAALHVLITLQFAFVHGWSAKKGVTVVHERGQGGGKQGSHTRS